nr:cytosolic protein [Microcystis aeruginosa S11-01]
KKRKEAKLALTKRLYEQGYQREDIINLFKFIDWLMSLPAELEQEFQQELNQYEEEKRMPYITSVERMGMEKGMIQKARESVIDALEIRFENVPSELVDEISQIQDTSLLKNLHRQAITLDSISDFQDYLNQLIKPE